MSSRFAIAALSLALALPSLIWAQYSSNRSMGSIGSSGRTMMGGSGSSSFGSGMGGSMMGSDPFNSGGSFLIQRRGGFVGSDSADLPNMFGGAVDSSSSLGSTGSMGRSSYGSLGSTGRSSYGSLGSSSLGRSSYGSISSLGRSLSGSLGSSSMGRSSYGSTSSLGRSSYGSFGSAGRTGYGSSSFGSAGRTGYGSSSYGSTGRTGYGSSSYGSTGRTGYNSSYRSSYGSAGQTGQRYGTSGGRQRRAGQYGSGSGQMTVAMDAAFEHVHPSAEKAAPIVAQRLSRSTQLRTRSPVAVTVLEGTAILRGEVASEHDRALAEQLARLEPGIAEVRNELRVATIAPSDAPPARSTPPRSEWRASQAP